MIISFFIHISHFIHSFIWLFLYPGYCASCCNKYQNKDISSRQWCHFTHIFSLLAGPSVSSIFNILRKLYSIFCNGGTNLYLHIPLKTWTYSLSLSPHWHYLLTFDNRNTNRPEGVFICIFLIISNVQENFYIHVSHSCVWFVKMFIQGLCPFLIGSYLLLSYKC